MSGDDWGSLTGLEAQRDRWRRHRRSVGLENPADAAFGLAGLARRVRNPRYRLLAIPTDPQADPVGFDDDFWQWWMADHPSPFNVEIRWGYEKAPTLHAAIRGEARENHWNHLIAAHRNGGIETIAELCVDHPKGRVFQLIPIVARTWGALQIQAALAERYSLSGPWEISLALRGTDQAHLGWLGEGWKEPIGGGWDPPACQDPNVLIVMEFGTSEWNPEAVAFEFGARIEDAWGFQQRRFLAQRGELEGQFDVRKLR